VVTVTGRLYEPRKGCGTGLLQVKVKNPARHVPIVGGGEKRRKFSLRGGKSPRTKGVAEKNTDRALVAEVEGEKREIAVGEPEVFVDMLTRPEQRGIGLGGQVGGGGEGEE